MENLKVLKNEFLIINERINEIKLNYNYQNGFKSDDDFNNFVNENKDILEKVNLLREKIRELEWKLMTPEQQARAKEVERLVKIKTGQIKKED